jgi:hypothetical protein
MGNVRFCPALLALAAFAAASVLAGCGRPPTVGTPPAPRETKPPLRTLRPLEAKGTTTLRGRATFRGPRPDLKALTDELLAAIRAKADDADYCLRGRKEEVSQQVWRIDERGGVANAFVWLQPPPGRFFKIDLRHKTWPDEVVIDQPHCAYVPHAVVAFPCYRDPARPARTVPSGQRFFIQNSGGISHTPRFRDGTEHLARPSADVSEPRSRLEYALAPAKEPIRLLCNIHAWMEAWVGSFEHPYAAVTGGDGSYEIRGVPAGVRVRVLAWHERAGWLTANGEEGDELELGPGVRVRDFTLQAGMRPDQPKP